MTNILYCDIIGYDIFFEVEKIVIFFNKFCYDNRKEAFMKKFKKLPVVFSAFLIATSLASCGNYKEEITEDIPVTESTQSVTEVSETTTGVTVTEKTSADTTAQTTTTVTTVMTTTAPVETTVVQSNINENSESVTDENNVLIQDENNPFHFVIEDEFVLVPETTQSDDTVPADDIENYDQEAYEKLGIKVNLHGTNEEQAQQYYDACVAAHPTLPWNHGSNSVSISTYELECSVREETDGMSDFEIEAIGISKLNGKNYKDASLEELYNAIPYFYVACTDYSVECINYWMDVTHKTFTFGGWTAL